MTDQEGNPLSYFVCEHSNGTVRAVQSKLRYALHYNKPDRYIVGPVTVETFLRLFDRRKLVGPTVGDR